MDKRVEISLYYNNMTHPKPPAWSIVFISGTACIGCCVLVRVKHNVITTIDHIIIIILFSFLHEYRPCPDRTPRPSLIYNITKMQCTLVIVTFLLACVSGLICFFVIYLPSNLSLMWYYNKLVMCTSIYISTSVVVITMILYYDEIIIISRHRINV